MFRSLALIVAVCSFLYSPSATGQNPPPSDPQANSFAAQSIAAMTGGTTINDATLTGNVTWNGSITDSGTFTLRALGQDESRMDLALSSGALTEIRDAQTGVALGAWVLPDNTAGNFAPQNCWTDCRLVFSCTRSLVNGADRGAVIRRPRNPQWNIGSAPAGIPVHPRAVSRGYATTTQHDGFLP